VRSVSDAVRYNERKVVREAARFALEGNLPAKATIQEKIQRMQRGVWCAHIALTFDPDDRLSPSMLEDLARQYLERIGFAKEPYLVYEHLDTFHPHLHVVVAPGTALRERSLHILSRKATRELERVFDLVRVQPLQHKEEMYLLKGNLDQNLLDEEPVYAAQYGKEIMARAMYRSIAKILEHYQFTSLDAYNALLRLYNIQADPGKPGSRIYEHRGLVYRLLDDKGKPIGMGIKASRLPGKPMLAFLEKRFDLSRSAEEGIAHRIKTRVDWILQGEPPPLAAFQEEMMTAGIQLLWQNDPLVYLDHRVRWALSADTLGPDYTGAALIERCHAAQKELTLCHSLSHTVDWSSQAR
jgi:hypothetical protein